MRLRPLHPMLINVVHTAIQVCEGSEFFVGGVCRSCGETLSGYDSRRKRFAILLDEDREHTVEVILHRAYCRSCGQIWMPEGPFYPGTRVGSPVVDLCRALSITMPYGQVATRLRQMGISVDRWSVRAYCRSPFIPPPTLGAFGMNIPVSLISLSSLAGSLREGVSVRGDDVLAACNHPSRNSLSI
jgi:hypothetical protein